MPDAIFACDGHDRRSSWAPDKLKQIKDGKQRPGAPMGSYANEPALRAMAAVEGVHLVVIDAQCGPGDHIAKKDCGHPFDRVNVYLPGTDKVQRVCKIKSWANDIVPALTTPVHSGPAYRVILHNGEKPGSLSGHFEATRRVD